MQVTTSIYNLIIGKLYADHYGTMRIQGNRDLSAKLKFKEQSILDRNPHQVSLFGAVNPGQVGCVWDVNTAPGQYFRNCNPGSG
jgi:hypothetical protein